MILKNLGHGKMEKMWDGATSTLTLSDTVILFLYIKDMQKIYRSECVGPQTYIHFEELILIRDVTAKLLLGGSLSVSVVWLILSISAQIWYKFQHKIWHKYQNKIQQIFQHKCQHKITKSLGIEFFTIRAG